MGPRKAAETALSMYIADHRKELQDQKPEVRVADGWVRLTPDLRAPDWLVLPDAPDSLLACGLGAGTGLGLG